MGSLILSYHYHYPPTNESQIIQRSRYNIFFCHSLYSSSQQSHKTSYLVSANNCRWRSCRNPNLKKFLSHLWQPGTSITIKKKLDWGGTTNWYYGYYSAVFLCECQALLSLWFFFCWIWSFIAPCYHLNMNTKLKSWAWGRNVYVAKII